MNWDLGPSVERDLEVACSMVKTMRGSGKVDRVSKELGCHMTADGECHLPSYLS